MKNTITIFIAAFVLLVTLKANAQWVPMSNGLSGGFVNWSSFVALGNNIFAGSSGEGGVGVYRTTNNGVNWAYIGLGNKIIYSLFIKGTNIYAGCYFSQGVYLSTNNGTNWTNIGLSLQLAKIRCFAAIGNNLFAGVDGVSVAGYYPGGVYLTTNNGTNWTKTALDRNIFSLTVNGTNIFAGAGGGGIYLSTNNGTNWTQSGLNNKYVSSLVTLGNNIFAGTGDSGVYVSSNNGASWSQTALNNKTVRSFAALDNNIFVGTDNYPINPGGIYLSTNNGMNWIQKNQGFNTVSLVSALLIANNYIFAGDRDNSVWRRSYAEIIGINKISSEVPSSYSLSQNYPNPFNPSTKIRYDLPKNGFVKLVVYDMLGQEVAKLVNETLKPGTFETTFDGSQRASGVYFARLEAGSYKHIIKMLMIK
jgi:hypothetical protein